ARFDELDHHLLLARRVGIHACIEVGDTKVLESGTGAAHAGFAGHDRVIDVRRECLGRPGRLIPDVSPVRLHQLAERLPPRLFVRRIGQDAVDVEDRAEEPVGLFGPAHARTVVSAGCPSRRSANSHRSPDLSSRTSSPTLTLIGSLNPSLYAAIVNTPAS